MKLLLIIVGLVILTVSISWTAMADEGKYVGIIGALLGIVLFICGSSITIIPSGYVGIKTSYGQISGEVLSSGQYFSIPFIYHVDKINCKQQEKDFGELRIWSETSERTEIYCEHVVVDYQINSEYAAWIWQNIEEWDNNLLKQTSIESGIKTATKQFNDTDVTNRVKIEKVAKEAVQKSLNEKYGNQVLNIVSVNIGNMNFTDAYNEAIEKKNQAKLEAEKADYENQKKIKDAEAVSQEKKIKAQGDAEATLIKAEAEAEANKKISESLTKELIQKRMIDKWDGKLPIVSGDSSPIINMDSLFKEEQKGE